MILFAPWISQTLLSYMLSPEQFSVCLAEAVDLVYLHEKVEELWCLVVLVVSLSESSTRKLKMIVLVLFIFVFYSSQWSPLSSSIRKLNPGASPSSSRGCCDRQSISFPTCVGGSEASFVETRIKVSWPRDQGFYVIFCYLDHWNIVHGEIFWVSPGRPSVTLASWAAARRTCSACPGSTQRCSPAE